MKTHSIGEVLNQLKDEFEDITISKIRFLETEGLIRPDRTESGYRKFTDGDIERLRYVLRAQRDRYLPLKVIKQELDQLDAGLAVASSTNPPSDAASSAGPKAAAASQPGDSLTTQPPADERYDAHELAHAVGLDAAAIAELRDHGLLSGGPVFDADDRQVAAMAAKLLQDGLEVRHLRMYRQFADREAAFAEQLIAPLLRQRNPDSRKRATARAQRLVDSGEALQRTLLRRQLRTLLRS